MVHSMRRDRIADMSNLFIVTTALGSDLVKNIVSIHNSDITNFAYTFKLSGDFDFQFSIKVFQKNDKCIFLKFTIET